MTYRALPILLLLALFFNRGFAQTDREFWFVAPNVDPNNASFNIPIVLRMTSFATPASVTISLPANPAFVPITISLSANSTQTVDLSAWIDLLQNAPPNSIQNKGILIQSTADITAYYEVVSSYCSCNPEVFSLKGKNALGNEFYVSSQYTYNIDTVRQPAATTSFDIVATTDNTTITITPTKDIVGHPANIPFTIVLNTGQTYSATGVYRDLDHHLQGSYIVSDKPIGVTLKDDLVFGDGTCADLIGDQTIPTIVTGNEYIVPKGYLSPRDRVFVLAIQDNTPIFLDGNSSASITLSKGQSWTFDLSNPSAYIRSDKKFYVYHVTGTGCELGSAVIPKLNCTGSSSVNIVRSSNDMFGVMLITKNGNQGSFTVNGSATVIPAADFLPVPGTGGTYVAGTIDLSGYLPAGSVLNFSNPAGKFSMGFLNGSPIGGSRYGFFSDYKSSNVQTSQTSICPGGSVQLNAFGGVSYQWSPVTGLDNPLIASPIASTSATTVYRAIITDADGCTDSAFETVTVDTSTKAEFAIDQSICSPLQVAFTAVTQANAAYNWTFGSTGSATGQNVTYNFPQTGTWPVTLNVTRTNACSNSVTKLVDILLQPAELIGTPDTPVCAGKPVVLRTRAALDFCWQPTAYLNDPLSSNPIAMPPATTKYYFTAKIPGVNLITNGDFEGGNTGFSSDYQYSNSGLPPSVYFIGTNPTTWNPGMSSCKDHTTGSSNMLLVNGSEQLDTKIWTETVNILPNTNYAFSAWLQSISNVSPALLQFSINGVALGSPLQASASTCIWSQFYTTWNSGSQTSAVISIVNENQSFSGNDFALDDLSFAPITLQIDSVTIDVETPSVKANPDTTVCPGMPVPLHVGGSLNYAWSPATALSNASIADPIATPLISTDYLVTGTSARGCIASDTITVDLYPRMLAIDPDTTICLGDPARLYASGGLVYTWSPAQYLDDPAIASPLAHPDRTTRFQLSITDGNQCPETGSVTVNIRPVPVFKTPPDERVCYGFGVPLTSANTSHYIYDWSPATGLDDPTTPYPLAHPDVSSNYSLYIRDSVCSAYDSSFTVRVTVDPSPVIIAEKDNDIDCAVHTAQLHSNGGLSYTWTPAAGLNDPLVPNPVASIDSTTVFIVKGTSANGCYAFDTLTVNVTATGANLFVVPNAFTPNGDGHNDCFGVVRWGDVQLEEMKIFNRWGQLVFTTRNPSDCWDGTFKGKTQPTGGYAYVIRAHSFCGEITRTGIVMLIR